jgi:PAS domain S-box-containing protein
MVEALSAIEYRLLLENSPVMIWRAGVDAKCNYFNATWLDFTGRSLDEEMGDGWTQGVHPEDLERCIAYYLDHFRRREPFEMEYRLRRHDGEHRWILDRGVPFADEARGFAGYIGSCVDVDDRRRAQAAREMHDQEQLAFAHEFERWILAIVSHDIRNPLGAIDGSARLLADKSGDPTVRAVAERITRSANRITHIVTDLLDVSRERHTGGIPIALAPADLCAICRDVVDEIATVAQDRSIVVACKGDPTGTCDRHRITQALSNLVANAVQHSPPQSPVQLTVHGEPDRVVLEVHNEGTIPPRKMAMLFEPFHSVGASKGPAQGLGLGLFIARAIAQAHRGDLEVDSTAERGTTFRVVLPRGSGARDSSPPEASA